MFPLIILIAIFVISLAVLIKASCYFTNAAEKIGIHYKIPPFIVGVTIVSIGTSLPELVSSVMAVMRGSSEIVIGNVIGSNIANIFLVLGIAAIIGRKLILTYEIIHIDLPLLVGSAFLLGLTILDGTFSLFDAFLCLIGLIIYFSYTVAVEKKHKDTEIKKEMKGELKRTKLKWNVWLMLVLSAFFIYLGARFTIDSVIKLAQVLSIGTEIIAASAVAIGTSLPELVVTVTAAMKGKPEMAVGNVLGSTIFNSFGVTGIAALFGTLIIPSSMIVFALPMMIIATLLFLFMTQDKEITKWEGMMLVLFYVFFILKLLNMS